MFRGAQKISVDTKGRMAIPGKYRDELSTFSGSNLIITAHPRKCLLLYPKSVFEPIEAKIMALSSFDSRTSDLQILLVGNADDVELDTVSRVLIPPTLREFAKLGSEVMFAGQGTHFQIWNIEAWDKKIERATVENDQPIEMPAELVGFSL